MLELKPKGTWKDSPHMQEGSGGRVDGGGFSFVSTESSL